MQALTVRMKRQRTTSESPAATFRSGEGTGPSTAWGPGACAQSSSTESQPAVVRLSVIREV